ncbi:MAG: efflux RND transporter periplasmic adaptor subunit, partial [Planctomycetaceae bacterium]|nr:efflux RND transporter periplasmic adaptor subunit [Planctomycetaceae bacterium]
NANEVIASQVELCQRRMLELEELKQSLPQDVEVAAGVESLQMKLDDAEIEYEELLAQMQDQNVQSPGYGLVGLFEFMPGQTVEEGELIVRLFDQEQLFVTVDVPSREVHRFQVKDELKLTFPNGQETRGRIVKIAPHVTSPDRKADSSGDQTHVRLWMEPDDGLWPDAPIGSQVEVSR